ncbi:dihydrodipicolinate synthase family protein [Mesorhizobium sp. LHD-90]|uniref:dihydrodipicolinate synthase family protein n=1 Tax=Mesorhizobium sp. LHD-90 TaxID=3071414 RepID=UPI0027E0CFAA|nr:dihydrodipicolinate synthase family protein [Mesorhizobium sp. LHD-90]MDQ6438185.1 dihydrodipicolinate synthase family protein [Mesorhizobium sp. LHD-90]
MTMLARPYSGLIAAPLLPMLPDASIDWDGLRSYMAWIGQQRPSAVAMNMDASEVVSLRIEEQLEVIRICKEVLDGSCPLLSGVLAGSTELAIELGRSLKKAGAEGLVVFPAFPTFLGTPLPIEMVTHFHRSIASGVELPIVAFQFPRGWGPDFTPELMKAMCEIPELFAIKESSFDAQMTIQAVASAGAVSNRPAILTGSDTFIFEALMMGCDGALIGFAGTATRELVEMQQAVARGDYNHGKQIWDRLSPIARYCWRAPVRDFRPRMKELLKLQGQFQHATVRLPQLGVSDHERAEIRRIASEAGLI